MDLNLIKKLREETGAAVMEIKEVLEDSATVDEARELLRARGLERASKKDDREASQGSVGYYLHTNSRVASLVSLACETDFVARTEEFRKLATELAMQVAAMNPSSVEELNEQIYIRDATKKIHDLTLEFSAKVGERVFIKDFRRLAI